MTNENETVPMPPIPTHETWSEREHEEAVREEQQDARDNEQAAREQREGSMFDGNYPVQNAVTGEEGSVVG